MVDVEFKIISIGEIKEAQMVRKNISNINRIIRLKIFSIGSVISCMSACRKESILTTKYWSPVFHGVSLKAVNT